MNVRKGMCKNCPHRKEVKTRSCCDEDRMLASLEKPHVCTWHPELYCRGVVEKFKMNGIPLEGIK